MIVRVKVEPGVRVAVRDVGEGEAVLLIHGWSLSHEVWGRQIDVLVRAGRRVLALDLRGHGASDAPAGGYDLDRLAADAVAVLDDRGVDAAPVVGWSLGGMTGLRMTRTAPGRVRRLVLVASTGVAASRHAAYPFGIPADTLEGPLLAGEREDRVGHRRRAVGGPFGRPPDPEVLDWLHRISLQTPTWAADACMRTLLRSEQVAALGGVRVPVTQIVGTADPAVSLRGARWVRAELGSTLIELDCGHYPMLELPDAFDEALLGAVGADGRSGRPVTVSRHGLESGDDRADPGAAASTSAHG